MTTHSPTIEAWIDQFPGATWELADITFDQINDARSRDNQARTCALDDATVTRYKLAAGAGAVFPPLVVYRHGNGLVLIDGNHRHHGLAAAGFKGHPAYIVTAPLALLAMMTDNANAINGVPPSDDEVRTKVASLAATTTLTRPQIAVIVGRSQAQVSLIIEAGAARQRITDQRKADKLTDHNARVIGRCVSDEALNVIAELQAGPKPLKGADLARIVSLSNKQRKDADRVQVILDEAALAQAQEGRIRTTGKRSDATKLNLSMGTIANLNPVAVALEASDPKAIVASIEGTIESLEKIKAAL